MMIKYAVVGAGWISQQAFLPGVGQSTNSKVTAIVTGDHDKAARLADFYGIGQIVGYDGYDALLGAPMSMRCTLLFPTTCMPTSPFARLAPASTSWSRSR